MIVELYKYLIYGKKEEMDGFFALAQRAGFIEFIGTSHKKALELPSEAKLILSAIKVAKRYPVHPEDPLLASWDLLRLAEQLVSLNEEREKLLEEKRVLRAEIARIAVFGDFSRKELDQLERETKLLFQFFCMKSVLAREVDLPPEMIFVGTEYDLDYFVAINKEPKHYPKMIEMQIDRPVGQLRARLAEAVEELTKVEKSLRSFASVLPRLQHGLIDCLNEYHLHLAKHDADLPLNRSLFAIEAWIPKTRIKALHGLLSSLSVQSERIAVESSDRVPTYMENTGAGKIGEDLVHIYDTPAPTDRDPSRWVLIFFSLFFAMIISDAGYGLIYLLIALLLKWKFPHMGGVGKRFVKLIFICATSCILWGILAGSYFGIEMRPDNPLRKNSLFYILAAKKAEYHLAQKDDVYEEFLQKTPAVAEAKDGHDFLAKSVKMQNGHSEFLALDTFYDNILMECAFLAGILHISLSFCRNLLRNWSGLGWIFFILGGYLYFPSILNATTLVNFWLPKPIAYTIGFQLIFGGIGLAFVVALIQKGWRALHELLSVIQVFADTLSYLRLYALALAGMVVASTFNDKLGIDFGFVTGTLVVLVGHSINIALSIMGGVIHGLRLNFLEWYHYCFEGGGRIFNPLRLRRTK